MLHSTIKKIPGWKECKSFSTANHRAKIIKWLTVLQSHTSISGNNLGLRGRQNRNILCPLFPREELNKFPKPYSNLQNRSLPNESRNESVDLILNEMLAQYSLSRPKIKKGNISPYNLPRWVHWSMTLAKHKPQYKQIDARGVYLRSQSLKIELCQERLFLYFWDVTPELWRFSLHLLVRGNQPQSAKFIKEMYIKTSLLLRITL